MKNEMKTPKEIKLENKLKEVKKTLEWYFECASYDYTPDHLVDEAIEICKEALKED